MTDKEKELQAEAIGYYRKQIAELESTVGTLRTFSNEQASCVERLEKENVELKLKLEALEGQTPWKDIKDKSEVIEQLTKAKEIIKAFLAIVNNDVEYVQNPQDCKDLWKELCEKAEQFLSEVENV